MNRVVGLLGLAGLVACGGDTTAPNPTSASLAGSYTLRTVNGSPLPFTLQSGTTKVVLTSDVLNVADGGTWSESGTYTITVNGGTTSQVGSDGGTYTRAGTSVTFISGGQTSYAGTFTGTGFNLADASLTYTFTR